MLPLGEDQKHRHRFTSQRRPATAVMVIIPLNFSRSTLIMTTYKNRQVKSSLEYNQIPYTGFSVYETISQKKTTKDEINYQMTKARSSQPKTRLIVIQKKPVHRIPPLNQKLDK